jgi:hypothetical protein
VPAVRREEDAVEAINAPLQDRAWELAGPMPDDSGTVGSAEGKAYTARMLAFWREVTDAAAPQHGKETPRNIESWHEAIRLRRALVDAVGGAPEVQSSANVHEL